MEAFYNANLALTDPAKAQFRCGAATAAAWATALRVGGGPAACPCGVRSGAEGSREAVISTERSLESPSS